MYATVKETGATSFARDLVNAASDSGESQRLPALEAQVCAEAGIWAPEVARRAITQAGGDIARSVALLKVWAATLPHLESRVIDDHDAHITRRISSAFAEVPQGQWLGAAPELASRRLRWDDAVEVSAARTSIFESNGSTPDGETADAPTRAEVSRVRDLLRGVRISGAAEGTEPVSTLDSTAPVTASERSARLGRLSSGETASVVSMAALILGRKREAVLTELTHLEAEVRVPHPRSGVMCRVATVPIVEAEAVLDAVVDGRTGFSIGWGATFGDIERRAIALSLLDGTLQSGEEATEQVELDAPTLISVADGSANNGFVEHLRLPHYASFASYLAQAKAVETPGVSDGEGLFGPAESALHGVDQRERSRIMESDNDC